MGGWSTPHLGALPPKKTRYPLYRRLGVPQSSLDTTTLGPTTAGMAMQCPVPCTGWFPLSGDRLVERYMYHVN